MLFTEARRQTANALTSHASGSQGLLFEDLW